MTTSQSHSHLLELKYRGCLVTLDRSERFINLNQLWKAAGSPRGKTPKNWQNTRQSEPFIRALERRLNVDITDVLKTYPDRGSATWGHWQIALAYAQYLNPDLHIQVNEWARLYIQEEIEPDRGVDRAIQNWKHQGKSDKWIAKRLEGKANRIKFTSTLSKHGVKESKEFAGCTNAIYKPVLGGTAMQMKEKLGLTKSNQNLRDNLSRVELAAINLAEVLAEDDIESNKLYGYSQCHSSCSNAGTKVKRALT